MASEVEVAACREALAVQDACNLCGVVHAMARHASALLAELKSTDEVNKHPAMTLFIGKLAHLNKRSTLNTVELSAFTQAYGECHTIVKRGPDLADIVERDSVKVPAEGQGHMHLRVSDDT